MNGKQAKRLRKAALGFAAVMYENGKLMSERGQELEEHRVSNPASVLSTTEARNDTDPYKVVATTIHNSDDSVRAMYRKLKKRVK